MEIVTHTITTPTSNIAHIRVLRGVYGTNREL